MPRAKAQAGVPPANKDGVKQPGTEEQAGGTPPVPGTQETPTAQSAPTASPTPPAAPNPEASETQKAPEVQKAPPAQEVKLPPSGKVSMVKIRNRNYAGMSVTALATVAKFDMDGVAEVPELEVSAFLRVPGYEVVQ